MIKTVLTGLLITVILLCNCAVDPLAGGSSQQGNGVIIGRLIIQVNGQPAQQTQVLLIPVDFDPCQNTATLRSTSTDEEGVYRFGNVSPGTYNVQALHSTRRTRALISDLIVDEDTTVVQTDTLKDPGSLKIFLPDTVDPTHGYFYIPGTTVGIFLIDVINSVLLDSVPSGTMPSLVYRSKTSPTKKIIRLNIPVHPGDTTIIGQPGWHYSRRLYLNTTPSGADVSSTVTDFPILVRLDSGRFFFAEAQANGEDIQFTKSDGVTELSHEIELWDTTAEQAVIWVKIDTICGNNSTQSIMMYWGNTTAVSVSNGTDVFDTLTGFQGVWHLGDKLISSKCKEATGNSFDGDFIGTLPETVDGEIGPGQLFQDENDYVDMGTVLNAGPNNITISAWIKRKGTGLSFIAGKSNGDGPYPTYGYLFTINPYDRVQFCVANAGNNDDNWTTTPGAFTMLCDIPITDTTNWHYVVAVMNKTGNTGCKIYIDGIDRTGEIRGDITTVGNLSNTQSYRIGAESDGDFSFKGIIDEVRVSFTPRSEDWLKLCYMNQRRDDALVNFEQN